MIGGTADAPAMVTIAASDANGNPLYSAAASNTSPATDAMTGFPEHAPPTAGQRIGGRNCLDIDVDRRFVGAADFRRRRG